MRGAAWDDETLDLLKRLWREGKTATAIGARLGGMSRSAVMGKIHRLRLGAAKAGKGTKSPKAKAKRPLKAETEKSSTTAQHPTPLRRRRGHKITDTSEELRPTAGPGRKTLFELTNTCCRWPLGRQGGKGFFFCGAIEADLESGRPYCERHMRRAYIIAPAIVVKTQRRTAQGVWGPRDARRA
jgi:GcrA cell cycle regulator